MNAPLIHPPKADPVPSLEGTTPVMAQFLAAKASQPDAIVFFRMGDFYELFFKDAKIAPAALVKAFLLQVSAKTLADFGFQHPLGQDWRGFHDIDPATLTRERLVDFLDRVDPEAILAVVPHGTPRQVAARIKEFVDAGLRVPKILDYGAMAGLRFAAASAENVRQTEDELMRLCGEMP